MKYWNISRIPKPAFDIIPKFINSDNKRKNYFGKAVNKVIEGAKIDIYKYNIETNEFELYYRLYFK